MSPGVAGWLGSWGRAAQDGREGASDLQVGATRGLAITESVLVMFFFLTMRFLPLGKPNPILACCCK